MDQSPSEANSHPARHEIPCLLWNRVHKGPPMVPILIQMNPIHILPPYSLKIHSNIIFPFTPRSSCDLFRFPNQNIVCVLSHSCYTPLPTHPPWLYHSK